MAAERFLSAALAAILLVFSAAPASAEKPAPGVEELRHIIGEWRVETNFLNPDQSVRATVPGTYRFNWLTEDKTVQGRSELEGLGVSGILFFLSDKSIEMVSVGPDGMLWRMRGEAGGNIRTTPNVTMPDGSTLMLRFTRSNVEPDRFESRMHVSTDGGVSWIPGNHQIFSRCPETGCGD